MREQATSTDPPPAGTREQDALDRDPPSPLGPARITGGQARLRVAGMPLDLERDEVARDFRSRRPNLLNALIHARALERGARMLSLLALDFGAILAAIFTALG